LIPRSLPQIGLGLWGLAQPVASTAQQLVETILYAHSQGLRFFECAPAYAQGRAVAALLEAGRRRSDLQISLTLPCVGADGDLPVAFLRQHSGSLDRLRVVGLQPRDKDALENLPGTVQKVHRLVGGSAISISNLPPHLAVLAAERIRAVFNGDLFIYLPSNSYTESINSNFLEAFKGVKARIIGYGLLLGGKSPPVGRCTYTYGQSVPLVDQTGPAGDLSVDAAEQCARGALSNGGCYTVIIGARTWSQVSVWADALRRISTSC
jgi:hypothetical protein